MSAYRHEPVRVSEPAGFIAVRLGLNSIVLELRPPSFWSVLQMP